MESSRVFVKGLPYGFNAEDLKIHFSKSSTVTDARLLPNRRIGYVGYKTAEDAAKAVKYYNKSFIRMSRIGVEPARSVEEQRALRPGANATIGVKRKFEDIKAEKATPDDKLGKKHAVAKAGDGNAGNAKLQEYLEVMKPPSKLSPWENQATNTIPTTPAVVSHVDPIGGANNESDEEYESALQKPKKDRKSTSMEGQLDRAEKEAQLVQDASSTAPVTEEEEVPVLDDLAPAASDADWLRSRTSRLLGFGDDEDDTTSGNANLPEDRRSKGAAVTEHPEGNASNEVSIVDVQTNQESFKENYIRAEAPSHESQGADISNSRIFVRNLTYTITEDDLRHLFEEGGHGVVEEVHLPIDARTGENKGFAHIQYTEPAAAAQALQQLDRQPFQGRLLHMMPANAKKETALDDFAISKLPLKKQQQIKRKAEAATSTFNWNSMYMNSDAVMSSMSDRLGVSKSDLLDPTSSDAAVKQAHAETHIIQETKSYFASNGVDLDAFKRKERGDTAILIKNFKYGTKEKELRDMLESHGPISRLLIPPSGTIAIVEFAQPDHARSAFGSLAYRKFKDSILFLEKAPKDLFNDVAGSRAISNAAVHGVELATRDRLKQDEMQDQVNTSTLYVRNLNFITTTQRLREIFEPLNGFLSARVKTKSDPKKPGQILSMGFGFLEFRTKEHAQAALAAMDGYKLDHHVLVIRASHKAIDGAEERRKEEQAKREAGKRTKVLIKNLPFEASRKDVRSLFGAYGQLRSVRVPKKFDSSTRGFAFAEFVTAREAENALDALKDTHLLGRRLVLEFAAEDALDPEQEIEKMQQKVGKQAEKVALQRLTGSARKKFNVEGGDELDQEDL